MADECVKHGGNAIIGMRFDMSSGDYGQWNSWWEVCAYGTACFVEEYSIRNMRPDPSAVSP